MKLQRKLSTKITCFSVLLILCVCVIIAFVCPQEVCYADSGKDSQDILQDNVDKNLSGLDVEALEELLASLDGDFKSLFGEDVVSTVKGIINGTFKGDFTSFLSILAKGLGKCVLDVLPMVLTVIAIAIIYSLL